MELLKKSYIDANLIINALSDEVEIVKKAMRILGDSKRCLMVTDYVDLETMPKMLYNKQVEQVEFTEGIFQRAVYIRSNDTIVQRAHDLANTYGLAAMDDAVRDSAHDNQYLSANGA